MACVSYFVFENSGKGTGENGGIILKPWENEECDQLRNKLKNKIK